MVALMTFSGLSWSAGGSDIIATQLDHSGYSERHFSPPTSRPAQVPAHESGGEPVRGR